MFGFLTLSSRWGATWRERDGVVRFDLGGYASSPRNRPEFASNLYHGVSGLRTTVREHLEPAAATSLEVGCGYGRLSPWIAERTDSFLGIDPNWDAVRRAAPLYPELAFAAGRAQSLPCGDGSVDLAVTWTVLQHVPEGTIREACAEIRRLHAPGGLLVACERVRPPGDDHIWPRSVSNDEELFAPLELVDVRGRPVEPTWGRVMETTRPPERLLVFRA